MAMLPAMSLTRKSVWQPVSVPRGSPVESSALSSYWREACEPVGVILIGEPYWRQLPPVEDVAKQCHANSISDFLMLPELLASFGHLGYDVVEMVLADQDSWDRYEAAKWLTMRRWLEANPDDEFARDVRARLTSEPERYAAYTREYLGWGVFALMPR